MIRVALSLLLLAAPCTAATVVVPIPPARPNPNWPAAADRGSSLLQATALALHNQTRREFGVGPVVWNDWLASEARAYAVQMAATGVFRHDPTPGRRAKMGENLWRGTRGAFSYQVMLGQMIDEREHFRPGVFPDVSATGDWEVVGHYTQMVWPSTTEVGCAVASNATDDYLVCRYAPTGNKDGVALIPARGDVKLAQGRD